MSSLFANMPALGNPYIPFWISIYTEPLLCTLPFKLYLEMISSAGFGNQFIFGYEVEVELSIQLENGNEVEYE